MQTLPTQSSAAFAMFAATAKPPGALPQGTDGFAVQADRSPPGKAPPNETKPNEEKLLGKQPNARPDKPDPLENQAERQAGDSAAESATSVMAGAAPRADVAPPVADVAPIVARGPEAEYAPDVPLSAGLPNAPAAEGVPASADRAPAAADLAPKPPPLDSDLTAAEVATLNIVEVRAKASDEASDRAPMGPSAEYAPDVPMTAAQTKQEAADVAPRDDLKAETSPNPSAELAPPVGPAKDEAPKVETKGSPDLQPDAKAESKPEQTSLEAKTDAKPQAKPSSMGEPERGGAAQDRAPGAETAFDADTSQDRAPDFGARSDADRAPRGDAHDGVGAVAATADVRAGAASTPPGGANRSDAVTSADRAAMVRQIADRVELLAASRPRDGVTIHLDPKELGSLRLVVKSNGGDVETRMYAQSDVLRSALEASRPQLSQALESRGLTLGAMTVGHHDAQGQHAGREAAPQGGPQPRVTSFAETNTAPAFAGGDWRSATRQGGGVDLWI